MESKSSQKNISFGKINRFDFLMKHSIIDAESEENVFNPHIHSGCEIYINVTGDVSFMVEGQLYNISPGDIIISRPFEYHNCIYNSNIPHEHYWILFGADGNEELLPAFFRRTAGSGNLIRLCPEKTAEMFSLVDRLMESDNQLGSYILFLSLINLLSGEYTEKTMHTHVPPDFAAILDMINRNFTEPISICELAKSFFISTNTLERRFHEYLGVSPTKYINEKRMALAFQLLEHGEKVSDVSSQCGFSDISLFIRKFKAEYGLTPNKYKKKVYRQK